MGGTLSASAPGDAKSAPKESRFAAPALTATVLSYLTLPEHLCSAALVSRSVKAAAQSPLSWPSALSLEFDPGRCPTEQNRRSLVGQYGLRVRKLALAFKPAFVSPSTVEDSALLSLAESLASWLEELSIEHLVDIPSLPKLRLLCVASFEDPVKCLNAEMIAKRLPALQTLRLLGSQSIAMPWTYLARLPQWDRRISALHSPPHEFSALLLESPIAALRDCQATVGSFIWMMHSELRSDDFRRILRLLCDLPRAPETLVMHKQSGKAKLRVPEDGETVALFERLKQQGLRTLDRRTKVGLLCPPLSFARICVARLRLISPRRLVRWVCVSFRWRPTRVWMPCLPSNGTARQRSRKRGRRRGRRREHRLRDKFAALVGRKILLRFDSIARRACKREAERSV